MSKDDSSVVWNGEMGRTWAVPVRARLDPSIQSVVSLGTPKLIRPTRVRVKTNADTSPQTPNTDGIPNTCSSSSTLKWDELPQSQSHLENALVFPLKVGLVVCGQSKARSVVESNDWRCDKGFIGIVWG